MSLMLDTNEAKKADRLNPAIRESGKYTGVITRAEKLLSKKGTIGLGISFKTDDGQTANYLDLYTVNAKGESLPSNGTVNAILACTRTKEAPEGSITFDAWDSETKKEVKKTVNGYPTLMGKRIGFLLQRELSTNEENGKENDRVVIFGVFEADSNFTATEILNKATKAETLEKMHASLMNKPIHDRRTNAKLTTPSNTSNFDDFADDIPFN